MVNTATPSTRKLYLTDRLREAILSGKYRPGDRLNECLIAREYGISPIPVREALFLLEGLGLVTNHMHRGMFVTHLSEEDAQRINSVRVILETEALKLARAHMTPALATNLSALVDRMEIWQGDLAEELALDLEFHRTIWEASGNPYLVKTLEPLVTVFFAYKALERVSYEVRQWRLDRHRPLLNALLNGDDQDIATAILIHLRMANKDPEKFSSLVIPSVAQSRLDKKFETPSGL